MLSAIDMDAGRQIDGVILDTQFTKCACKRPTAFSAEHDILTHLTFATDGKVALLRDYWDAAVELYGRLAILRWLIRALARQAAASHQPG